MINEENLNKMYEGLIEGKELTTKQLNEYGLNSKNLTVLVENGTLSRIKRGYYSLNSVEDLFYYGKKMIAEQEYDKATSCFEKCFDLDPNHIQTCFQLFLNNIQNRNYEKALEYFDNFYYCDNPVYLTNNKFYLYLLSMIVNLPEKFKKEVKKLKFDDMAINLHNGMHTNVSIPLKIRISAYNQKFRLAYTQLKEYCEIKGAKSAQDFLIQSLLQQAIYAQNKYRNEILDLLKQNNYKGIYKCLSNLQLQHKLNEFDSCVLSTIKNLINIMRTEIVPIKHIDDNIKSYSTSGAFSPSLYEAIEGQNYELAWKLFKTSTQSMNDLEKEIMELLLKNINYEISKLTKRKNITNYNLKQEKEILQTVTDAKNESILQTTSSVTTENILEYLLLASTYIRKKGFYLNVHEYIQNFYEMLTQNRFDEARNYLDIIFDSDEQTLISSEKLNDVINPEVLEPVKNLNESTLEKNSTTPVQTTNNSFDSNNNEYYGIEPIRKIAEMIINGISVQMACENFNLSEDQIGIVNLIFAREYYIYGNYSQGDKYLKKAEKIKNKSKTLSSLLKEIKLNKKFYQNNIDEKYPTLLLKQKEEKE